MSHGKQFTLYTHDITPNGRKIAFFLNELGLTYEPISLDFNKNEHKSPWFLALNPNGRIPALIDHSNDDFVIWESNVILLYLADKYDPEHKLSASTDEEKYKELQWLFFQASGQGPYFGQAGWFMLFHPENVPSAIERYQNEAKHILGVLDGELAKCEWLVSNKYSIVDLSFISWTKTGLDILLSDYDAAKEIPHVDAWLKRMLARPAIQKVLAEKTVSQ